MIDRVPAASSVVELPLYPSFSFDNKEMDALVPSCRVKSWQHFTEILNEKPEKLVDDMIYRGHRRCDWQLESTLAREFNGGAISPGISKSLLEKFRLAMRGRGFDLSERSANEIWAFGQHFGLATTLLDWTASPFVALFFAFLKEDSEQEKENPTRAIFRINRSLVAEVIPDLFFEPTLGENARLVNQAGLFTVTPEGGDNLVSAIINGLVEGLAVSPDDPTELARYICKFHIPNEDRMGCMNSLRRMNIHHANLFPDPTGASEYCNDWLSRAVFEERRRSEQRVALELRERRNAKRAKTPKRTGKRGHLRDIVQAIKVYAEDANLDLVSLAEKLNEKYDETHTVDWPRYESATARLRSAFKRILLAAGFSEPSREKATNALLEIYRERYSNTKK